MHQTESFRKSAAPSEPDYEAQSGCIRSIAHSTRERIAGVDPRRLGAYALIGVMGGTLVAGGIVNYVQTRPYEGPVASPKDFTFLKVEKGESFTGAFLDYGKEQGWTKQESTEALGRVMSLTIPQFADTRAELKAGIRNDSAYGITIVDMDKKAKNDEIVAINTDVLTDYAAPQTPTSEIPHQP